MEDTPDHPVTGCGGDAGTDSGSGDTASDSPGGTVSSPGGTVRLALINHPWVDALKAAAPEFEAETGITLEINTYDDAQLSQLYNVKLNAGSDEFDVMGIKPLQESQQFTINGWVSPLNEWIDADPDWDWGDFQESARAPVTIDGQIVGVPIVTETAVLFYRTDLLAEAGLEIPTTFDELKAAVETIQALHPDIYGFVGRGERSGAVTQFSSFLYSMGGDWVGPSGDAAVDTEEAIAAYEYYGGMLRDYGPPGAADHSRTEAVGLFQQGLGAFYPESNSQYNFLADPTQSTVAAETGVTGRATDPGDLTTQPQRHNQGPKWKTRTDRHSFTPEPRITPKKPRQTPPEGRPVDPG